MGRLAFVCLLLTVPLSGCAIARATGSVISATGSLVGATANVTAGAIDAVAGGGGTGEKKKNECADKDGAEGCSQPASSE